MDSNTSSWVTLGVCFLFEVFWALCHFVLVLRSDETSSFWKLLVQLKYVGLVEGRIQPGCFGLAPIKLQAFITQLSH